MRIRERGRVQCNAVQCLSLSLFLSLFDSLFPSFSLSLPSSHTYTLSLSYSHMHTLWLANSHSPPLSFNTPSQNKEALKSTDIINKLAHLIPCSSPDLVTASLRLLFNLSFDSVRYLLEWVDGWMNGWLTDTLTYSLTHLLTYWITCWLSTFPPFNFQDFRIEIIRCGLVPKLINLLRTPAYRARTLKLLYHLSADEKCKAMMSYSVSTLFDCYLLVIVNLFTLLWSQLN